MIQENLHPGKITHYKLYVASKLLPVTCLPVAMYVILEAN